MVGLAQQWCACSGLGTHGDLSYGPRSGGTIYEMKPELHQGVVFLVFQSCMASYLLTVTPFPRSADFELTSVVFGQVLESSKLTD